MSRKKIFGALFVVAVLVLAVLSSTVRSKVSLADERKYEELPQQENIYLSANKEQPQDAIEYQPMDSIELSSELELSPLGLPSDFSQEEIEIYKTVLQDFYDMQETIQFTCNITQTERIAEVLRRAYTSVECFWVSKLQWMHTETENGTVECSVIPQYSMSREERDHALLIINKHVYSGLCLNNWLYGEEDRTFRRFSMAALQSTEDLMMAERLARSMCREIEKPIS